MIQELLIRADQRGYVTFEDVLEVLDEDGDDANALEALLYELDELGVELRQENGEIYISALMGITRDGDWEKGRILPDDTALQGAYDLETETWEFWIDQY